MDTINGLPAHPLLVHFAVVGVLAAGFVALAIALWPRARRGLGVFPSILALVTLILVPITTSAGESFEKRFPHSDVLERHANLGDELILTVGPLFGVVALLWLLGLPAVRQRLPLSERVLTVLDIAVRVATIALAISAIVMVILVGHSGARAVWGG